MSVKHMAQNDVRPAGAWHARFSAAAVLLGIGWLAAWFYGLAGRALAEPDEGRYAEVAHEMFTSGDWITPRLDGFNFFDKPPLHYWASATAYALFGAHPWSARLWCALTGLLAIVAIGWAGARLFGREAGGYAAVILGSSLLFVFAAHINTLDMGVTAFLAVGMACFLVAQFDPTARHLRTRLNLLMWAALALAVLSKGLIGVVFPGMILGIFMLWQRDWGVLRRVSLVPGVLVLLVLCAPWFILICRLHPDFFDYFFIREHFTRFLTSADGRSKVFGFFLPVVILGMFPWTLLLPWNRTGWRAIGASQPAQRFLLVWVSVVFVFFSASHSQLPFYILPVFPALALLLGRAATVLPLQALARRFWLIATLTTLGAATATAIALAARTAIPKAVLQDVLSGLSLALVLMALAAMVGTWALHRGRRRTAIHGLALATLIAWQLTLVSSQPLNDMRSADPVARLIQPELGPHTEVFTVHAYLRALPFYLGRPVTVVDQDSDDLTPGLASRPDGYIADLATFEQRWRASHDAIALVADDLVGQLRSEGLPFRELGREATGVIITRHETAPPLRSTP